MPNFLLHDTSISAPYLMTLAVEEPLASTVSPFDGGTVLAMGYSIIKKNRRFHFKAKLGKKSKG